MAAAHDLEQDNSLIKRSFNYRSPSETELDVFFLRCGLRLKGEINLEDYEPRPEIC